jgi:hypothetical protein
MPERVDIEYLRDSGISEGMLARTLFAMKFLGLVKDGGEPTSALRDIGTGTDEEYRTILAGLIRGAYEDVFANIDPSEDDHSRILNFFRRYTPASQRERMVTFFLAICREAGIPTLDVPRKREISSSSRATRVKGTTARKSRTDDTVTSKSATQPDGMASALEMLIRTLPPVGTQFPRERKKQWITMAEVTLDYVYPDTESQRPNDDDDIEEEP